MIVGTGIDLTQIERIEQAIKQHGQLFLDKIFTQAEQQECLGQANQSVRLAGRFAAKEAVAKAFGTGIGTISWRDIETVTDERGRPMIRVYGRAQALARERQVRQVWISLTHDGGFAVAQAILEG